MDSNTKKDERILSVNYHQTSNPHRQHMIIAVSPKYSKGVFQDMTDLELKQFTNSLEELVISLKKIVANIPKDKSADKPKNEGGGKCRC